MVMIPAGTLLMGSDEFYPDERPVHERPVAAFWIDRYEVTNAEYAVFVDATGYVTVAERELDPAAFPGADPAELVPGAMVFTPSDGPVDLRDWRGWWRWQPGASWRHPFGPGSSIEDRQRHPVVHVAYEDALAYATWAGKRLPSEAEHEYAARGGRVGERFAWGDEAYPGGVAQANTWLGRFPYDNRGVGDAAPVGSYPPNGYGLYDMTGNVWEWTASFYNAAPASAQQSCCHSSNASDPFVKRVVKGGSFLCAPNHCLRYRPAARQGEAVDTSTCHIGFRCIARSARA